MDDELKALDAEDEEKEEDEEKTETGGDQKKKVSTLTKIKNAFILFFKTLLLLAIFAITVEACVEAWIYSNYLSWQSGMTLSVVILIVILIITWKKINFSEKWVIAFIYPIVVLTLGTVIYGIENEEGPIIFTRTNPQLINILFMFVAVAITVMFFLSKTHGFALKIIIAITAIITIIGFTIPIIWMQNLHQALQGQASSLLQALPFFLRPTFLGIFIFYPLSLLLIVKDLITSVKYEHKINRINTVYPIIPIILLLTVGIRILIISAPVEKVYLINEITEKGRCNIVSQAQGGSILDFTSQLDIYDSAAYKLIDGDIFGQGWQSERNAPFPQDITFTLPGKDATLIDQVIIYNDAKLSDSPAAKEVELLVSSGKPDDLKSIQKFICKNTTAPQILNFKEIKARFVRVRISSNWGNTQTTSIREIEISGPKNQDIKLDPLKGNLLDERLTIKPIYFSKKEQLLEEIPYKKPFQGTAGEVAIQLTQEDLPVEIIFNLPESKTYIIDNLVLNFFSKDEKPREDITEIKEMEILVSADSPVEGFESLGKFLCTKGTATVSFSLQKKNVKYLKLKLLKPMEENKFIVIKNLELYQPMARYGDIKEDTEYRSGLRGVYFAGKNYNNFQGERKDSEINFSWGVQSPMSGLGSGNYSILWDGILEIPSGGYYELGIKANEDDTFKLYINNEIVIKNPDKKTEQWITKKFRLTQGLYTIKLMYFHPRGNDSTIKLGWKKPGKNTIEIIENKYLTHKSQAFDLDRTPKEAIQQGVDWMGEYMLTYPGKYASTVHPFALMTFSYAAKYKYPYNIEASMKVLDLIRSGINKDGTLAFYPSTPIMALELIGISMTDYNKYIRDEKSDELIRIANRLVGQQLPAGKWDIDEVYPPLLQGDIQCTTNALLILLETYTKTRDEFFSASIQPANAWIETATPETTQDIIYQIIALVSYPSPSSEPVLKGNIEKLYEMQNKDGGWGVKEKEMSNSLSTAQVVYALKLAGVGSSDPEFNRGLDYLIKKQNVSGSWSIEGDKPLEAGSTMWAISALANAYESLMIRITKPADEESFMAKDLGEDCMIETEVYNPGSSNITKVEFFIDDLSIGQVKSAPYNIKWEPNKLSGGKHTIKAVLYSDDKKTILDTKTIYVDKSIKITFISPKEGPQADLETNIKVKVENKSNSPITKVEYYIDEELIDKVTKEPFELKWLTGNVENGNHILKAVVYNEKGDSSSAEQNITFDRHLEITLETPEEDANIEGDTELSSKVVNETGSPVAKVEYYLDETLLGSSTEGPLYKYKWELKDIKNGNYTIKAVAYTEIGNKVSSSHNISVSHSLKIKIENISEKKPVTGEVALWVSIENESGIPLKEVIYYLDGRPVAKSTEGEFNITDEVIKKLKGENYSGEKLEAIKTLMGKGISKETLQELKFKKDNQEVRLTEKEVEKILSLSKNEKPYKILWDTTEYASGTYEFKVIVYSIEDDKAHTTLNITLEHPIKISFYATVVTGEGKYSISVKKDDFIVEENGEKQKLLEVKKCEENVPTSYCILMDTGKHMGEEENMDNTKEVIQNFINQIPLKGNSLIIFSDEIIKKEELTKENKDMEKILEDIEPEGGSAIYDALYEGINQLRNSSGRKVVVLFTAGIDENEAGTGPASKYKIDKVLEEANNNNCLIYIIAIGPWADTFILSDLTNDTGGRCYSATEKEHIQKSLELLNMDLKCHYNIIYQSSHPERDGQFRSISVTIKEKESYKVNCQKGYNAPEY